MHNLKSKFHNAFKCEFRKHRHMTNFVEFLIFSEKSSTFKSLHNSRAII